MTTKKELPVDPSRPDIDRRQIMRYAAIGGADFASVVLGANRALAAAADGSVPPDKSAGGYTLTAAYSASPPAIDEAAFTMEVENMLALTYGGDFMQYKPVPSGAAGIYVADMVAPGNDGVIGRWVDKWEGTPGYKTWTFHIRPGIRSWAGNEMTTADIVWTWQRGFEMKSVRYFFARAMFLEKSGDIEVIDKYTLRFHLSKPSPVMLKLMAMSYFGGPFDATLAKQHSTETDRWAKAWLRDHGFGPSHIVKNVPGQALDPRVLAVGRALEAALGPGSRPAL